PKFPGCTARPSAWACPRARSTTIRACGRACTFSWHRRRPGSRSVTICRATTPTHRRCSGPLAVSFVVDCAKRASAREPHDRHQGSLRMAEAPRDLETLDETEIPAGVDRRTFLMRSAVVGAATVLTGRPVSAKEAKERASAPPPRVTLSPELDVVKRSKGPVM